MANAAACLVTGYVRLDLANRSHDRYAELGRTLTGLHRPTVAFLDGLEADAETTVLPASLERCWLWPHARNAQTPPGNPGKDTAAYHAVQHQKSAWLAEASNRTDTSVLVWIDYGILHVPGVTPELVGQFLQRAATVSRITLPSIWPLATDTPVDSSRPCWFVAGGVVIVPRAMAHAWHVMVEHEALTHLRQTGHVTWEVNTWARVIQQHPSMFAVYPADHNATLFSGFA